MMKLIFFFINYSYFVEFVTILSYICVQKKKNKDVILNFVMYFEKLRKKENAY